MPSVSPGCTSKAPTLIEKMISVFRPGFEVAQLGYRDLLMWFVQAGVNLNATDRDEQGILTFLTAMGEPEMVEFVVTSVAHKTWRV